MSDHPSITLAIEGMTCAACVSRVEKALSAVPGVTSAAVNLATKSARVEGAALAGDLVTAVDDIGYGASVIAEADSAAQSERAARRAEKAKRASLIAGILSLPFLIGMAGMVFGVDLMPAPIIQFALATLVQFGLGFRFYRSAYQAIRSGSATMDLLVAIGTTSAYGLSLYLWLISAHAAHGPHLYFESSSIVISFVLIGKWLEERAMSETASALKALGALRPETARVIRDDREVMVPIDTLHIGDHVTIRAGETIPVDGKIIKGGASIDESMITGESLPVRKMEGASVIGGTVNLDGLITVSADAIGAETVLARVMRLVASAQASKAPVQALVDRISAIFVPIVLGIALITGLAWTIMGADSETAVMNAVSVLVVACPCAMGLATPTSILAATGVAARYGILMKDAASLERAAHVTTMVFDKTGTLTIGHPQLTAIEGGDPSAVIAIAAALEAGSTHPLADAIRHEAATRGITIPTAHDFALTEGAVLATVSGEKFLFGNPASLDARHISLGPFAARVEALVRDGHGISLIADLTRKIPIGLIAFADPARETSKEAIERLHALGISTVMLTGDTRGAAHRIAQELAIGTVYAEMKPEDKAELIRTLKAQGAVVAMLGDGVNDAPALAMADVGIAMGSGTDIAIDSAGIALMRPDPRLAAAAISVARRASRTIQISLFWAFAYNVVGIPLAALGFLSPVFAGGAMALSSVSVVLTALTLRLWTPRLVTQTQSPASGLERTASIA